MNKGGEETTKHGLGGREQKQNVPLIVCACACVCLVTPELSLLGGDGEGQEEKEKKICQHATVVRVWGHKKYIMRTSPLPATMEQKGNRQGTNRHDEGGPQPAILRSIPISAIRNKMRTKPRPATPQRERKPPPPKKKIT